MFVWSKEGWWPGIELWNIIGHGGDVDGGAVEVEIAGQLVARAQVDEALTGVVTQRGGVFLPVASCSTVDKIPR